MTDNHYKIIMELPNLRIGIFLTRHNRFAGELKYNGKRESAHIHDPGRLKELLISGVEVLFTDSRGKLKYYIKAVKHEEEWVLIDSGLHSKITFQLFSFLPEFSEVKKIKREFPLGTSRIDFMLDGIPLEVKGVTLVKNGIAMFPDAPTERGTRHVKEIIKHNGIIFFLIFRKAEKFVPNEKMDNKFSEVLKIARKKGIEIFCIHISFDGRYLYHEGEIPLGDF